MRTRRAASPRARKAPAGIPALLPQLRAGRVSADAFFRRTSEDFVRMAAALLRGWDVPPSAGVDDVAQELRRHLLAAIGDWKPERGQNLSEFAIYRANTRATKWLDGQRKARSSREASRYPLLLIDAVEREERERLMDRMRENDATPEEITGAQERADLARKLAIAMGMTVEDLARVVAKDPDMREEATEALLDLTEGWDESAPDGGAGKMAEEWT